jgi:two-component SAPR family response regulator
VALARQDKTQAIYLTTKYMELCRDYGIYDYFRKPSYESILKFAAANNITPEFTMKMIEFSGRKLKKACIRTMGGLSVYPVNSTEKPVKMRTKKERELLAFLLEAGSQGATKESIIEALWFDSDSEHIKKLIGVYLAHIKRDLAPLGIENPVIYSDKSYMICRDEIEVDVDMLELAITSFTRSNNIEAAQKIISLYKGEYLAGFEALWATAKRLKYRKAYEEAVSFYRKSSSQQ